MPSLSSLSPRAQMLIRLTLFLGSVGLLAFALYYFFIRESPKVLTQQDQETNLSDKNSGLPVSGTGGKKTTTSSQGSETLPMSSIAKDGNTTTSGELTRSGITSPTLINGNSIAYYDSREGRFYTITNEGSVSALSLQQFPEAEHVVFAPNALAAALEFPDGTNIVYSFANATQVTLPTHWEDFAFSQDGKEIVAKSIGSDVSNRSLVITSTDGTSTTVVADLGKNADKVQPSWSPKGEVVAFSETGDATSTFGQRKIYTLTKSGEAQSAITVNGTNYENIWSPSGDYILYSIADAGDDYKPSLWYVDAKGDRGGKIRLRLPVKTTVDRCTFFNETTLYCGVPKDVVPGSGGNPEVLQGPDLLYKISLPSGEAELLAVPAIDTAIKNPKVNNDASVLFYTDERDHLKTFLLK